MAVIRKVNGIEPKFGENNFIADNATIVGDVECGDNCSFWFNSVVRGDVHSIRLGHHVNVQDGAIIHCTHNMYDVVVGNYVSIAHNAIVHGCHIKDYVLIGMGAIVMDGVVIESNSIVAAGSVVLEGTHIEANSIYAGIPAKKVKDLTADKKENLIKRIAEGYPQYGNWYD